MAKKKVSKAGKLASAGKKSEARGVAIGAQVRGLKLPGSGGVMLDLSKAPGKTLVLYFYPKDNTPGCTLEGQDFARLYKRFQKAGAEIYGVSRDSLASHTRFCEKMDFPFALLSDEEEQACKLFDVIKDKSLYGRFFRGIERSTFVLDSKGILQREWRKVKVKGHAEEVLEFVESL